MYICACVDARGAANKAGVDCTCICMYHTRNRHPRSTHAHMHTCTCTHAQTTQAHAINTLAAHRSMIACVHVHVCMPHAHVRDSRYAHVHVDTAGTYALVRQPSQRPRSHAYIHAAHAHATWLHAYIRAAHAHANWLHARHVHTCCANMYVHVHTCCVHMHRCIDTCYIVHVRMRIPAGLTERRLIGRHPKCHMCMCMCMRIPAASQSVV